MDNQELIKWAEAVFDSVTKGTGPYVAKAYDDIFLDLAKAILSEKKNGV